VKLIDSSVWIQYLKRPGDESVRETVSRLLDTNQAAVNPVVVMEILRGAPGKKAFNELRENFKALPLIPISAAVWDLCCELGFELKTQGITVPSADLIIAASAIKNNVPVVHRDRHFEMIAGCSSLKTEPV
jgi:predicted nucleic acid-binding protein